MILFGRIVLVLLGAMFLVFGAAFLVWPVRSAAWVNLQAPDATARTELRAFYGGMEIALAGFLFFAAAAGGAWLRPGLLMGLLACAGPVAGRSVGLAIDGRVKGAMYTILAVEAGLALLAAAALVLAWRRET